MKVKVKQEKELLCNIPKELKETTLGDCSLYEREVIRLRSIANRIIPVTLHEHAPETDPPYAYKYLLHKEGDMKYYGYIYPNEVEEVIE